MLFFQRSHSCFYFYKNKILSFIWYTISPQVVCGAYHSLALVRSLPNSYSSQKASEKSERSHSPLCSAAEREELFGGDSGHYCPLGVELTEGMAAEVSYPAGTVGLFSSGWSSALVGFPRLLPRGDVQGEGSTLEDVQLAAAPAPLLLPSLTMGKRMLKGTRRSRRSPTKTSFSISCRSSPTTHWRCSMWLKTPNPWAATPQVSPLNSVFFFNTFSPPGYKQKLFLHCCGVSLQPRVSCVCHCFHNLWN